LENSLNSDLDLKIKKRKGWFLGELAKVFPPRTKSEMTLAARMAIRLGELVEERERGIEAFDDAVRWAKESSRQNVESKRKLFTAKFMQETGMQKQGMLLEEKNNI
jgi:septal ring factor EnvC (AmiA/AmiB activator)